MQVFGFKFKQNRTISEEFDFLRGERGGIPILKFYSQLLLGNMKMFRFKFQQNRILNEKFDFWRGKGAR